MTVVRSGDVEIVAETIGVGDPPLVLVHGYIGSRDDWTKVAPALSKDRRVITFDHRGHGESTNIGDPAAYTFDNLVDDVESVINTLGPAPVHLLGHSMGGVVAQRYALRHPESLTSLILMDTAAETTGAIPHEVIDALVTTGRTEGMAVVADLILAYVEGLGQHSSEEDKARARAKFSRLDVEAVGAFGAELSHYPSMLGDLALLDLPATVIVGENDTGLREAADKMAATIPGATLVVIPGAGHSPQEDDPAAWLAAVEGHLARAAQ